MIALLAHLYAVAVIGTFLAVLPYFTILVAGFNPIGSGQKSRLLLQLVGFVLGAGGGALSYSCMMLFITRGKGTAFPTDPPRRFVVLGPYRYVRNPMYIGNLCLATGIGLIIASWTYLLYTLALAIVTHCYIVISEEPRLRTRFGTEYEGYRVNVRRWLPKKQPYIAP